MLHSTLRIHRNDEMENLFASAGMAAGYASSRPPVHRLILEIAWPCLAGHQPPQRALDLGCGSGLSTRALLPLAAQCFGVEPAVSMLRQASAVAPVAAFAAGSAEQLPFGADSMDVITAAGSLNYCAVEQAFPEMLRVLKPGAHCLSTTSRPAGDFAIPTRSTSGSPHSWSDIRIPRTMPCRWIRSNWPPWPRAFSPVLRVTFEGALLLDQPFIWTTCSRKPTSRTRSAPEPMPPRSAAGARIHSSRSSPANRVRSSLKVIGPSSGNPTPPTRDPLCRPRPAPPQCPGSPRERSARSSCRR